MVQKTVWPYGIIFLTPDAFNSFVFNLPAVSFQKGYNTTLALTTLLASEADNLLPENLFLVSNSRNIPLS